MFGKGSQPDTAASVYPSATELRAGFEDVTGT
jgi:hypothetical protein